MSRYLVTTHCPGKILDLPGLFLTIALDPSFTGESGGLPRRVASPDINVEAFSAAVDFLMVQPNVDHDKVGILGITLSIGNRSVKVTLADNEATRTLTELLKTSPISSTAKKIVVDDEPAADNLQKHSGNTYSEILHRGI